MIRVICYQAFCRSQVLYNKPTTKPYIRINPNPKIKKKKVHIDDDDIAEDDYTEMTTTVYAKYKKQYNISAFHPRYFSYRYSIFINPIPRNIYPLECILLEKFVPLSHQDLCLYTLRDNNNSFRAYINEPRGVLKEYAYILV